MFSFNSDYNHGYNDGQADQTSAQLSEAAQRLAQRLFGPRQVVETINLEAIQQAFEESEARAEFYRQDADRLAALLAEALETIEALERELKRRNENDPDLIF